MELFSQLKDKNLLPKLKKLLEIIQEQIVDKDFRAKIEQILLIVNQGLQKTGFLQGALEKKKEPRTIEVEDKYRVVDLKEFQKAVLTGGFNLGQTIIQEDIYCDLGKTLRRIGQSLRVRRIFDESGKFINGEFKWEGTRGELQDRPVYEIKITDKEDLEELVRVLQEVVSMAEFMHFKKQRFSYSRKELSGRTTEIELDSFEDPINLGQIRGKIYAQFVQEVVIDERKAAIKEVQKIADGFGLKRDNRDYTEIARGLERK